MTVEQSYVGQGPDELALLAAMGIGPDRLLGSGGEARVFALDQHRVLRIFAPSAEPADEGAAALLAGWSGIDLGFDLPRVLGRGRWGQQDYSIEVRMRGLDGGRWLAATEDDDVRRRGLLSALEAASRLAELPLPRPGVGRLLEPRATFPSLIELYAAQIEIGLRENRDLLASAVPDLQLRQTELLEALGERTVQPAFTHGDLAPSNVMFGPDGRLSGVLDISVHALVADPVLDLVGLVAFLELTPYRQSRADAAWLQFHLAEQLGDRSWLIDAYRRYYALYYAMDAQLIAWCAEQLNRRPAD